LHFENEIEHKILVTYVIAKVSGRLKIIFQTAFNTKFCWDMIQTTFAADCITAWFEIIR